MSDILFSVFPNENFVDIGLYQYGWEQCEPSHSFGPAARNHYVFHYVISGTGTLMANDSSGNTIKYQVKSGQGFMLLILQIRICHGNIPGLNLTDSALKRLFLPPDSVPIIRSITPVQKTFAMK